MKNFIVLISLLALTVGFAQEAGTIKGTVLDGEMNQEPLLFANVQVQGTKLAAQTNFHGNFEFEGLAPGSYVLQISFLGYESKEVAVVVEENKQSFVQQSLFSKELAMDGIFTEEDLAGPAQEQTLRASGK